MKKALDYLLGMLEGLLFLGLMEAFSRGSFRAMLHWALSPPLLFLCMNALFFIGIALMLRALPRFWMRWLLFCLLGLFFSLIGIANRYKMQYRFEPLLLTDTLQLQDTLTTIKHLDFSINHAEILLLLGILAALCMAGFLLHGSKTRRLHWACAIIGLCMAVGIPFCCTFALAGSENRFDLMDQCDRQGVAYTLFAVENHRRAQGGINDTEPEIRKAYRQAQSSVQPVQNAQCPNIILILGESYADEAWLRQYITPAEPVTPVFNRLRETCRTGQLYVPKIGGGTSETEFEVLTGIASVWGFNPYCLALPSLNSTASVLHAKGYTTSCIHWYHGGYYNRYHNLRMLGFDTYYTTDTNRVETRSIGMFNSDADHYRTALEKLKSTPQQDFLFLITIQNHGGYTYADFGYPKAYQGSYSEETDLVLRNYMGLIKESDRALGDFLQSLEALEEETWVVFFSDHIPPFGKSVFEELGVDSTSQACHLTPYFIWCSKPEKNRPVQEACYAYELAPYALESIGLLDDPFFTLVNRIRAQNQTPANALKPERRENAAYTILCRDMLFGKQYSYSEGKLSVPGTLQIGGDLTVHGLQVTQGEKDTLIVTPQTADWPTTAKLYVNGHEHGGRTLSLNQTGPIDLQFKLIYAGKTLNESNVLHFNNVQELLALYGKD